MDPTEEPIEDYPTEDYPAPTHSAAENLVIFLDMLMQLPDKYRWKAELLVLANELNRRMLDYPGLDLFADKKYSDKLTVYRERLQKHYDEYNWQQLVDKLDNYFSEDGRSLEDTGLRVPRVKDRYGYKSWREALESLSTEARLVLLLGLAPHLYAGFLDQLLQPLLQLGIALPELGGTQGTTYRGLLPTGAMALFMLAGTDLDQREQMLMDVLVPDQLLLKTKVLSISPVPAGEPRLCGLLVVEPRLVEYLLSGYLAPLPKPETEPTSDADADADFPAQPLSTNLTWADLVLPRPTRLLVDDISSWLNNASTLRYQWGLDALLKPGYRALFYGPSGTGKTLTATLLGQQLGRTVYRVDLSMVLSKYIGETEKSLGRLFEQAQSQNWILFFDEADALFGKRTETRDAHDRFANQEVAFLLQKVEEYDGLVILATNLKGNIDTAFSRRFQAMIPFPMPAPAERKLLWDRTLLGLGSRAQGLPVEQWAARYELTGASILNVVQFAGLRALGRNGTTLTEADVIEGIRLEYQKDGKLL
jgi:hypothetical protein